MKVEKPFKNPPALWKWIKREVAQDNVESVSLETIIDTDDIGEGQTLKRISNRIVTIKLGSVK